MRWLLFCRENGFFRLVFCCSSCCCCCCFFSFYFYFILFFSFCCYFICDVSTVTAVYVPFDIFCSFFLHIFRSFLFPLQLHSISSFRFFVSYLAIYSIPSSFIIFGNVALLHLCLCSAYSLCHWLLVLSFNATFIPFFF